MNPTKNRRCTQVL